MSEAGLWRPKLKRLTPMHPIRARRPCRGELVQIDGSPHDWFEDRGARCCLLVFIDDATSELMTLHFVPAETTAGYMQALWLYVLSHGLPACLYSARHSIFCTSNVRVNAAEPTQFQHVLNELGIEGIRTSAHPAPTPTDAWSVPIKPYRTVW